MAGSLITPQKTRGKPDNFIAVSLTTSHAIKWCQAFSCDGCSVVHRINTQSKVDWLTGHFWQHWTWIHDNWEGTTLDKGFHSSLWQHKTVLPGNTKQCYPSQSGSTSCYWGFYKSWSTCSPTRPDLAGRNCPLSAMGVKVSLVCSNSTVLLRIDMFSQYSEVINSINPREAYMHHWPGSPLTQVMAWSLLGAKPLPEPIFIL